MRSLKRGCGVRVRSTSSPTARRARTAAPRMPLCDLDRSRGLPQTRPTTFEHGFFKRPVEKRGFVGRDRQPGGFITLALAEDAVSQAGMRCADPLNIEPDGAPGKDGGAEDAAMRDRHA